MLAVFVLIYLAGIPFAAGILGEKCGKGDWAFAAFIGVMSWAGAILFMSMMFAMFAATRLYRAGMWASNLPFDLDW
jgi:hypothetical protein